MGALTDLIREKILWVIVSSSLLAGLVAAYGRERHDGRFPDRIWWTTRMYILPFLGIVTGWCVSRFNLTNNDAAMLSAVLALLGYEAVRLITAKAKRAGEVIADKVVPEGTKPFHAIVDTDDKGRPAAHVEVTHDPTRPRRSGIGAGLRETFSQPPDDADLPPDLKALLGELDQEGPDEL